MKNRIPLALVIILLTGCITVKSTASPTSSGALAVSNTVTPTVPIFPEIIPTSVTSSKSMQNCPKLENADLKVVLGNVTSGTIMDSLLDIQTGKEYKQPSESKHPVLGSGVVSPNGNMYAYLEDILNDQYKTVKEILWVINAHADTLTRISIKRTYLGDMRWLDNERLILNTDQTQNNGEVMVINPFVPEQYLISNDLPGLSKGNGSMFWLVEYSPNLSLAAYFGTYDKAGISGNQGVIIRDVVTNHTIWEPPENGGSEKPLWTNSGEDVALISNGQLYIVNRYGQGIPVLERKDADVTSPAWSPNGQYIAFWNSNELMVYNRQTNEIFDLCIKSHSTRQSPPKWSLNNSQLWANGYTELSNESINSAILIDIQKNVMYKTPNIYLDVWMNSLP